MEGFFGGKWERLPLCCIHIRFYIEYWLVSALWTLYLLCWCYLPRSSELTSYKRENMLVGIIPGPTEPPLLINTYLSPLVSELLDLWDGITFQIHGPHSDCLRTVNVRAALIGISCDIPAGRKVCGFLSHCAKLGCSRYCKFGQDSNESYSKFERDSGRCKQMSTIELIWSNYRNASQKQSNKQKELEIGCRYSVLLILPYFDPVQMLLIDPMHNLFLGTAKYVVRSIWIGKDLLSTSDLDVIYWRVKRMKLHMDITFVWMELKFHLSVIKQQILTF